MISILIFLLGISICPWIQTCNIADTDLRRFPKILQIAWQSCQHEVNSTCIMTKYCDENVCDLKFEDLEQMKPQANCSFRSGSAKYICKILLSDSCMRSNNSTRTTEATLLILIVLISFIM